MNNNIKYKFIAFSEPENKTKTEHNMLDFFTAFNPIELKYSPLYDSKFYNNPNNLHSSDSNITLTKNLHDEIKQFEKAYQTGNLTKQKYNYIEENLQLVYGHDKVVHNDVLHYHNVKEKIIHNYLAIPQLERMFDEDYFNFEWDMHVGQNFKEHRNDYNRDHFVHQIRNLYMMMVLLGDFNFYKATHNLLQDETCGKISQYTINKLKQFENNKYTPLYNFLSKIQPKVNRANINYKIQHPKNDYSPKLDCNLASKDYYIKNYFLRYVIYGSTMLSALFHDMGYPICHFLETRHRVSEYNPTMHMFTHNSTDTFDQLASILNDSLLFTIVSADEIKENLKIGKNGRYNHGVYSAIAFLLQFYNNGAIYSLSPEKQCAIELAAVAIYDHTANFNCIKKDESNNYYQQVFRQNPISFLLRFCDDLQEWDRRYFEFSEDSDLSICKECLTPFIPQHDDTTNITSFACKCSENNKFRYNSFLKRKLYVVRVAKHLLFEKSGNKGKEILRVNVNYDLYKLLKMARINNTYAKFRLGDLNKLKKLIGNQNFEFQSNGKLDFKYIYLDYFITSNPLLIKIKIIENYFSKCIIKKEITESDYLGTLNQLNLNRIFFDVYKKHIKIIEKQERDFDENDFINSKLYMYLNQGITQKNVFNFYIQLLQNSLDFKFKKNIKTPHDKANEMMSYFEYNLEKDIYKTTLEILIEDCFIQYSKLLTESEIKKCDFINSKIYTNQFTPKKESEELFYQSVGIFCKNKNYFNKYSNQEKTRNNKPHLVNYYTDLYFFYLLNEFTKDFEN